MQTKCQSCPFGTNGSRAVRDSVEIRILDASQLCHHPRLRGKKETHICRGARDEQLIIFHCMEFINEPTDAAWAAKCDDLGFV